MWIHRRRLLQQIFWPLFLQGASVSRRKGPWLVNVGYQSKSSCKILAVGVPTRWRRRNRNSHWHWHRLQANMIHQPRQYRYIIPNARFDRLGYQANFRRICFSSSMAPNPIIPFIPRLSNFLSFVHSRRRYRPQALYQIGVMPEAVLFR